MKKASSTIIAATGMTVGLLGFALPAGAATHLQDPHQSRVGQSKVKEPPKHVKCFKVERRDHHGKPKYVVVCVVQDDHDGGHGKGQPGDGDHGRGNHNGGSGKGNHNGGHGPSSGGSNGRR